MSDCEVSEAQQFLRAYGDYMSGVWCRWPPKAPGMYFVRPRGGSTYHLGIREIRVDGYTPDGVPIYKDMQRDQGCRGVSDWAGDWWSRPIPPPIQD